MEEEKRGMKWTSIVWAALLMFAIPVLAYVLIPAVYATYVGFSSRGDQAQINAAVQTVGSSTAYRIAVYVIFAAVGLWRAYVLFKKAPARGRLHVVLAVVIAAILVVALFMVLGQGSTGALVDALILSLLIAGGAFLGSLLRPAAPAAV